MKMKLEKLEKIFNTDGNIITTSNSCEYITFKGAGVNDYIDDDNIYANEYDELLNNKYHSDRNIELITTSDKNEIIFNRRPLAVGDVIEFNGISHVVMTGCVRDSYLLMRNGGLTCKMNVDDEYEFFKHATKEQIAVINSYKRVIDNLING